jgi:SAM-dependent methyltransferase
VSVRDRWDDGSHYEAYIGRWSRVVARRFVGWLDVAPGRRWVDVGCGTGALASTVRDLAAPALVLGVEPSFGFASTASVSASIDVVVGRGESLPLGWAVADVAVSGLVLNFVADLPAALGELQRIVGPGGTIAAYVWDYAEGMVPLRLFWDAAAAVDPSSAALDEGTRFPLCREHRLAVAFEAAGLADVQATAIDVPTPFLDFDDYWSPFLAGQGPAPSFVATLDVSRRDALREELRARFTAAGELSARAWAVQGTAGS